MPCVVQAEAALAAASVSWMPSLLDSILQFATRHGMFARHYRVGVAVSGGADSVCLLEVLVALRQHWDLSLEVIHLDHQLRGAESEADAEFVRSLAERHRLAFVLERANVTEYAAARGENLEQAARNLRLEFFRRLRAARGLDRIATGHTRSDQAETVLLRFLRGSGASGLTGILPVTEEGLVRPLLETSRSEIEQWLSARGIPWRLDRTNQDPRFRRNRIRLETLPALIRDFNPRLEAELAQTAELARAEEQFWKGYCDSLAAQLFLPAGPAILLPCAALAGLPQAVVRRLVRLAIERVKGHLRQIEFRHVESVVELIVSKKGSGRVLLPGADVLRSFDWVRIGPTPSRLAPEVPQAVLLQVPGETVLEGVVTIHARLAQGLPADWGYNKSEAGPGRWDALDWERLAKPLSLRCWRPGDAYQQAGAKKREKLKDMFQKARIPLWERRFWPIIESSQEIVWSRRFGPSRQFAPAPGAGCVLLLSEAVHQMPPEAIAQKS